MIRLFAAVVFLTLFPGPAGAGSKAEPPVIVIDPGHGGHDSGAKVRGVKEEDLVLSISKRLKKGLSKTGVRVFLTRSRDEFLTLDQRDRIANEKGCDLFLSIHANSARNKKAQGIEIYSLNKATDEASRRLAARENRGVRKKRGEVEALLSDLLQTAQAEESVDVALAIKKSLARRGLREVRLKSALFYVLVGAKCPSLLIETGFMTNRQELKKLGSVSHQDQIADSIAEGVSRYLTELNSGKRRGNL